MPVDGWSASQAIATSPSHRFRGTVWRVHWRAVAPTDWHLSLRSSGRYHRGLDLFPADQAFPALYTSLAPEIAIWEMVRRSATRNVLYLRNNVLTERELDLDRVLDLSDPAGVGLTREDLTGSDHGTCQDLAATAVDRGFQGLLVPSAALPGVNLVLFPRHLPEPPPIRATRSTELPLDALAGERPDQEMP